MDIELYYQEKGTGEPFIFLHGNGENSSYFGNQINYFQRKYRVIALDTRGHGKSPRGDAPFTIEQFSCDLYDFMNAHQIPSAIILGFSDGANIAMKFAMKHPNMVKALILNGGNLNPKGVKRITMPTLVICGTNDMIKESHTKEIAENLPDATLTILKGTHFIANKCPAEFNRTVDDFLKTV